MMFWFWYEVIWVFSFFASILCSSRLSLTSDNTRTRTYSIIRCSNIFKWYFYADVSMNRSHKVVELDKNVTILDNCWNHLLSVCIPTNYSVDFRKCVSAVVNIWKSCEISFQRPSPSFELTKTSFLDKSSSVDFPAIEMSRLLELFIRL